MSVLTASNFRAPGQSRALTIIQRLINKDKSAVKDCIDKYGGLIWTLAKKYTSSIEEAETATVEIFADVWRYAQRSGTTYSTEECLISRIAWSRLVNEYRQSAESETV